MATPQGGAHNPVCKDDQDPRTQPCSNDIAEPKTFVPTREQLVQELPALFAPDFARVPIERADKR